MTLVRRSPKKSLMSAIGFVVLQVLKLVQRVVKYVLGLEIIDVNCVFTYCKELVMVAIAKPTTAPHEKVIAKNICSLASRYSSKLVQIAPMTAQMKFKTGSTKVLKYH